MTTPRKPVKGWVVVGPNNRFSADELATSINRAWMAFFGAHTTEYHYRWERQCYRAVPVVVMERGKK